jgi:hypothetical protein
LLLLVTAQSVNPGGAAKSKPVTVTSEALAYDKATGAVKASGNVVIETTEATITAGKAEIRPKTDVAQRAAKIIIPNVEFRDVPLSAVVEFFVAKGREFDPEKKGVNIVVQLPPGTQPPTITLSLQNIPLLDAMKYVAALSVLELVAEPQALRLQPKPVSK